MFRFFDQALEAAAAIHAAVGAVERSTDITAAAWRSIHVRRISALAITGLTGLTLPEKLVISRRILPVLGIHCTRLLETLERVVQPSAGIVDAAFQKIPLCIPAAGRNPVQQFLCLGEPSRIDHSADVRKLG